MNSPQWIWFSEATAEGLPEILQTLGKTMLGTPHGN